MSSSTPPPPLLLIKVALTPEINHPPQEQNHFATFPYPPSYLVSLFFVLFHLTIFLPLFSSPFRPFAFSIHLIFCHSDILPSPIVYLYLT
ncbi:hypothetical protein BO86DRAFT_148815 [Aspergillus japonicus CBS 114.51]|uniref:Uncharacterized protein n=1 Tax=Aspergillus japonicus CBS 114.51 TaxID=1448312 RepID=A0A8T8WVL6_ASPJA|nr:hypothetical protein BO86DRAFT_148815 [Aspergillus japonicus CBS 114.51]RAH79690.1 hypothetical protein BO86DRAFT_148815 [Aspergillus japonicus CBS 114.51]